MSSKSLVKSGSLVAKVVDENYSPCAFCHRIDNDETLYGKLYAIGKIYCHYFCVLLSCCLIQKGSDDEGLLGFLYPDILAELERSKKHRCSYCGRDGATLGCAVSQCRKQFHLPCGKEHGSMSLFFGNYKSYCVKHAPRQTLPKQLAEVVRRRSAADAESPECVCVICYEGVSGRAGPAALWPPCCARDAWFHRACVERMTLNAGVHYLKCPLCNDKETFLKAVLSQGYYVPDRDAAWELDRGAFADMYARAVRCDAERCACPRGRDHDEDDSPWDVCLCIFCGHAGRHAGCPGGPGYRPAYPDDPDYPDYPDDPVSSGGGGRYVCAACRPAAPPDLTPLLVRIDAAIEEEERRKAAPVKRVMPSRMSLRRTKPLDPNGPTTSRALILRKMDTDLDETAKELSTRTDRLELNLKSPKKHPGFVPSGYTDMSPLKHLDHPLLERARTRHRDCAKAIEALRAKFKKPRPLCEKKRIINAIFADILKESPKARSPPKVWQTPKKVQEITEYVYEVNQVTPQKTPPPIDLCTPKTPEPVYNDESSRSTWNLDPEFIGHYSDDELDFESPKLTTVDLTTDKSMEISKDDSGVNIDLISEPSSEKKSKCAFKFNAIDKERLEDANVALDVESFKSHYLTEVGNYESVHAQSHKREESEYTCSMQSAVDLAFEAAMRKENVNVTDEEKARKRAKRRRAKKNRRDKIKNTLKIKLVYDSSNSNKKSLNVTLKSKGKRDKKRKPKTKVALHGTDVKLQINVHDETKGIKDKPLTQTILNFSPEFTSPDKQLIKPKCSVTPMKRKYKLKRDRSNDSLKQTSIQNFFNFKPKSDEL